MRVAFVQDYLRGGGTEAQTVFLAGRLARAGHEVLLLTFRPGGVLALPEAAPGLSLVALQPFDMRLNVLAPGLVRRLRAFAPDAVICMGRVANARAARIQRALPQVPVIGTVRTGKPLPASNRRAFAGLPAVAANSRWWQRELQAMGLPVARVHCLYNACTRTGELWDKAAARQSLGVAPDKIVFLNAARMHRNKRQLFLLEAAAGLPKAPAWELWLAGAGPERGKLRRRARALGLQERVRFPGYCQDLDRYLAAADTSVTASIEDSLPNFLVEAQWAGLPVIATGYRGVAETFAEGQSGLLVSRDDLAGFTLAMRQLAQDSALRVRMAAEARRVARERFDPETGVEAWLKLLREVTRQTSAAVGEKG